MNPKRVSNGRAECWGSRVVLAGLVFSLFKASGGVPEIVSQPQGVEAVVGARVVLSVFAYGTPAPACGWQKDGIAVPSATNETLILGPLSFRDSGSYTVTVTNTFGATSSLPAIVTVRLPRAGDLDYSFDAGSDIDDFGTQVKVLPDGKLLVGGEFSIVHGAVRGKLARFNRDGTLDFGFLNGMAGANSNITCVAVQPDGNVIVAGSFNQFNGVTRSRMARVRRDGSLDTTFFAGSNFWSSTISAVALQGDGRILVGGTFTNFNGTIRNRLLRLTATGALDTEFLNGLSGASLSVLSILVQPDNQIVVAGSFNTFNGEFHNRVARLNPDGSLDAGFPNDLASAPSISGAALQADGKILVAGNGSFVSSNGVTRPFLARLNADGTLDATFLNNLSGPVARVGRVFYSGGKIFITGDFWEVNGQARAGLACLNLDGGVDAGFFGNFSGTSGAYKTVADLARDDAGGIILAGAFTAVNGVYRPYVARVYLDGTLDAAFMPGSGPDAWIYAVGLQSDQRIVLGGFFTNIGTRACGNLARLDPSGTVDPAFKATGANSTVTTILTGADDKLTVAGSFTEVNGWSRNRMARLNPDGSLDRTFLESLLGFEYPRYYGEGIFSAVIQPDDKVLAGGDYGRVNGVVRTNITRLNVDGALDTGFASNAPNDWVTCVVLQTNGGVLLGGYFTAINNRARTGLARLLPDGTLDGTFVPSLLNGYGTAARIERMALQKDGKLLLHGDFYTINGTLRPLLARLNADGGLDTTFLNSISGPDDSVTAMKVLGSGKILLGGQFKKVNGISCRGIARLNGDGSVDTTFTGSVGYISAWQSIYALTEQDDGKILVAGGFSQYNGEAFRSIVRLYAEPMPLPSLTIQPSGTQVMVSWPSYYAGWGLQKRESPIAGGEAGTNWLAVSGSRETNRVFLAISPSEAAWLRLAQ